MKEMLAHNMVDRVAGKLTVEIFSACEMADSA